MTTTTARSTCAIRPDILVVTQAGLGGAIHLLDGATGMAHTSFPVTVNAFVTPAIGDIDDDGIPEVVSAVSTGLFTVRVAAFEHTGALIWTNDVDVPHDQGGAVAIANLDADGLPEIIFSGLVVAADGTTIFQAPEQEGWIVVQRSTATIAADLDDDGDLEVILGQAAYHHDGTEVYNDLEILPGYPQVANLDDDDDPEIIINNASGITILEHDGTHKFTDEQPTGDVGLGAWFRPATVHDFDGDGVSDFAVSSAATYAAYRPDLSILWQASVADGSGWAAGTAFDFLGDGTAEAMYADERNLFAYDETGSVLMSVPRSSGTLIEYPVVADVDNDGSAEIVVVSEAHDGQQTAPSVQVIRDRSDRWIQARRIWNQHAYHVTNVREDGTIPVVEPKSWLMLNTYRTNAQIEDGAVCDPPEG